MEMFLPVRESSLMSWMTDAVMFLCWGREGLFSDM